MTFTPESVVIIIGALALAAVQIITALRQESKIAAVHAKADVIAEHVDGAASASVTKIETLTAEITRLTRALADEKLVAERLARFAGPTEPQHRNETP